MRLSAWIQPFGSVSLGIAVLAGCAGQPVNVSSPPAPERLLIRPGKPGFVVAALQGGRDTSAAVIATEIAQHTGYGLVAVPATSRGAPGQASEAYERAVLQAAGGPLTFLVEIRGLDRAPCAGQIEIATVGVSSELALRMRALAELIRDAHLRANSEVERLRVVVDESDGVTNQIDGGSDAVRRWSPRALQIALPRCARRDWRETYGAILADFVTQAAAVPAGR
jgi:hypothetical protein